MGRLKILKHIKEVREIPGELHKEAKHPAGQMICILSFPKAQQGAGLLVQNLSTPKALFYNQKYCNALFAILKENSLMNIIKYTCNF